MRDLTQEFESVALLLQRVVIVHGTDQAHLGGVDLEALPLARRIDDFPDGLDRATGAERSHLFLETRALRPRHHLQTREAGAVGKLQEGDFLRMARRAEPALNAHHPPGGIPRQDFTNRLDHSPPVLPSLFPAQGNVAGPVAAMVWGSPLAKLP